MKRAVERSGARGRRRSKSQVYRIGSGIRFFLVSYVLHLQYRNRSMMSAEESSRAGGSAHSVIFLRGVVHRVENGWGLTKVAAVLSNGLIG